AQALRKMAARQKKLVRVPILSVIFKLTNSEKTSSRLFPNKINLISKTKKTVHTTRQKTEKLSTQIDLFDLILLK
ncbi:MAG: hypothetical protein JW860_13995, partial [Sedimentisphaerales bacterium]|nr:hypothetical protein [Sedimentisphaerales bacterium]